MNRMEEITLRPIGWVESPIAEPADDCWGGLVAAIQLDERQFSVDSLRGLEEFSHVQIVFFFHKLDPASAITGAQRPRGRSDWPEVGVFAMRTRNRPNRLGVTTCAIVRIEGTKLWVSELDAIDGTPVLDIKPYLAGFGPRTSVREPDWATELMSGYWGGPRRTGL